MMKINLWRSSSGSHSPTEVVRISLLNRATLQKPGKHELRTDFQDGGVGFVILDFQGLYSNFQSFDKALAKDIAFVSGVVETEPPEFPINRILNSVVATDKEDPPVPVTGIFVLAAA